MEQFGNEEAKNTGITRRGILRWGTWTGAFLSVLGIFRMLQAYLSLMPTEGKARSWVLGEWKDLQNVDVLKKDGIYLIRDARGLYALRGECTHLGCRVRWVPRQKRFECPCHGSRYDRRGRILAGPAQKPLIRVYLRLNPKGEVIADLSRRVPAGFRLQAG